MLTLIHAKWPAPRHIQAVTTTRTGGQSKAPFDSNNLALHVGDHHNDVEANRRALSAYLQLSHEPAWLNQTHSTRCVVIEDTPARDADAAITRVVKQPLVILTADCLPIVLCNRAGDEIAAIHAGWRGLANGIVEQTIAQMHSNPAELLAWIGPGICGRCYAVGAELIKQFSSRYPYTAHTFADQHADLALLASLILTANDVSHITPSNLCTFEETNRCYSYRRNSQTGRIATLIQIKPA